MFTRRDFNEKKWDELASTTYHRLPDITKPVNLVVLLNFFAKSQYRDRDLYIRFANVMYKRLPDFSFIDLAATSIALSRAYKSGGAAC
jgi:hypothetical protein